MAKIRDDGPMTEEEKAMYRDIMEHAKNLYKRKHELGAFVPFKHDFKNESDDVFADIRNEYRQGED